MGTVKSNFNSTLCQDHGLCFRRQHLTDECEQITTEKKKISAPSVHLFEILCFTLHLSRHHFNSLFPHQLPLSFAPSHSPPLFAPNHHPPFLLLYLCCIRAPVVSARHKWIRAPGGPRLLCHTSLTLSLSITQTGPAILCPMQALPPGCHGNQQSSFFFFLCCWCLIVSSSCRMDGALGGCSHIAAYARSSGYLNSDAPQHHFSLFFLNTFLSTVGALCISMHRWRRWCVDKWCHEYFICQRNPLERTGVIKIH